MTIKDKVNIILLGEPGIGKSTFINAFWNYFHHADLNEANKSKELIALVETEVTITNDDNYETETVKIKALETPNGYFEINRLTDSITAYEFSVLEEKIRVNLVEMHGIGSVPDESRIKDIVVKMQHVNAICILLKPNQARLTPTFMINFKSILYQLNEDLAQNVLFIFTGTRGTSYRPGQTFPLIKEALAKAVKFEIPIDQSNTFCLDNECFQYLVALITGIKFSQMECVSYEQSWKHSAGECKRLLRYIVGDTSRRVRSLKLYSIKINSPSELDKLIERNESDPGEATIRMRSNNDNGKNEQENLPERRRDTGKPKSKNGYCRKRICLYVSVFAFISILLACIGLVCYLHV